MTNIIEQARLAKEASTSLRNTSLQTRNAILTNFANQLLTNQNKILAANQIDLSNATNLKRTMIDRLTLNQKRIEDIAKGILDLVKLDDPIHKILEERNLASGIHLKKISVPIGVVGIIYEARPNVTADCAALCIKSGNACVLKGGKESYETSYAIIQCMKASLQHFGLSEDVVMLAEKISHEESEKFMQCREYVDVLIPRGSSRLIQSVIDHAKVPVIETGAGICHVYVASSAKQDMALEIIVNAKCQRPSVCNAIETVLVHQDIANEFIPKLIEVMQQHQVTLYADKQVLQIEPSLFSLTATSYDTEYNDYILNVGIVANTQEAIAHIAKHSTHHSESIISEDIKEVEKFFNNVDSACVYHNASTRFTDGFEFGLGAEIGISTQKLHARGPMGLEALTSYMYQLEGHGEIRK